MPAARVPGPQKHSDHQQRHHPQPVGKHPVAAPSTHAQHVARASMVGHQNLPFEYPPNTGWNVRYFYTVDGQPVCEVWKQMRRVNPPPGRLKQADPKKKDCLLRIGDTMVGGTIQKRDLRYFGFTDPGSDIFTALLFWLLDIGEKDEYTVCLMVKDIKPSGIDPYQGRVLFYRYIVAGDNIFPCPRQSDTYEDLTILLINRELAEELLFLAKILEWEVYLIINVLWALTGGLEVKAAEEVGEKYVARALFKAAIKYIKPKFLAIVKGYIEGFVKELAAQAFKLALLKARRAAATRLENTVSAKGSAITVEQIRLIQSSADLKGLDDKSIDWKKCHLKGMEEALKRIWQIIPVKNYANESFRRAFDTCMKYIDKFFFDLKIKAIVEKGDEWLSEKIYKVVADTITEWAIRATGGKEEVTAESAEHQVREIALRHLADGTIFDLAYKYLQDNWDLVVKQALDAAQGEIIKVMKSARTATAE